ncbi:MAG: cation diffusion facilitator family transporter [Bacteroidia bacterium]
MGNPETKDHGTGHIIQSLLVNVVIAIFKGIAAFITGSGAMFAETIHSFADCANQLLLLVGVRQSRRLPNEKHPIGYGRAAYFWSFMVAMLLFSVGGMFSVYEGVHKFNHPEPVEDIVWALAVIFFAIVLEGYSTISNIKEINKRKGNKSFFGYISGTKDSDLIVVFGENSAAVLGLIVALVALLAAYFTGDGRYDAIGSVIIGLILILVAVFLATEVKSLLIGESADPNIIEGIYSTAATQTGIIEVVNCRTVQQGPGEVLACVKINCQPTLTTLELSTIINSFEHQLRTKHPEIKWLYIEPDVQEWKQNK